MLGRIGEPAFEPLVKALADEGKDRQRAAAIALGFMKEKRAVDLLIDKAQGKDEAVSRTCIAALGRIADIRAAKPLTRLLMSKHEHIRGDAADAPRRVRR